LGLTAVRFLLDAYGFGILDMESCTTTDAIVVRSLRTIILH